MKKLSFPNGFIWGTATAGHQVEGHNEHSDWWRFEQEGKIYDGTKSGRCMDYWNRFEEDHALMSALGYGGFRLGIEWAKIEPEEGRFDLDALERYREILSSLRKRGIKICLTLYHWVLPRWFADKGGWERPDAVRRFLRFAEFVVKELGEYPDLWVVLNEPAVVPTAGFLVGEYPPEKKSFISYCRVWNTFLRAHAKCYEMIHNNVRHAPDGGPVMVGAAGAYQWVEPDGSPGLPGLYEKLMSPIIAHGSFGAFDEAILSGRAVFPFGLGETIPGLRDSFDFCGVNYYIRMSVKFNPALPRQGYLDLYQVPPGVEKNEMGWQIYPPGFHKVLRRVWDLYRKPIFITENGVAEKADVVRPRFLLEHLAQLHRAIRDGVDVRGYFYWSFIDNFEWREGFVKKLGLIECDHADPELTRRPRRSAYLYSDIARENAVTEDIVERYAPSAHDGVFGDKWMI